VLRAFDVSQKQGDLEWSNRTPLISHNLGTGGKPRVPGTAEASSWRFDAATAQELWSFQLGTPSRAAFSFAVDGKQYIAVAAGWNLRSQVWFGKDPSGRTRPRFNWSDLVVVFGLSE